MADDGLSFGTNHEAGVCIHFAEKVPSRLSKRGHSALTVTAEDLEELTRALGGDPHLRLWRLPGNLAGAGISIAGRGEAAGYLEDGGEVDARRMTVEKHHLAVGIVQLRAGAMLAIIMWAP